MKSNIKLPAASAILFSMLLANCVQTSPSAKSPMSPSDSTAGIAKAWPGLMQEGLEHVTGRIADLEKQPPIREGALFLGDSLTEGAPLATMFSGTTVANYGAGWDTTDGVLMRLDQVMRNRPDLLFLLIGINDLSYDHSVQHITQNIEEIVSRLQINLPGTDVYVISILPAFPDWTASIRDINTHLSIRAVDQGYTFIDLNSALRSNTGSLREEFTTDGLHLNEMGYGIWRQVLGDCVVKGCNTVVPSAANEKPPT